MATQWYIRENGQECGPLSFPQLEQYVRDGRIDETTSLRPEKWPAWQRAGEVIELKPTFRRCRHGENPSPTPAEQISLDTSQIDVAALAGITANEESYEPPDNFLWRIPVLSWLLSFIANPPSKVVRPASILSAEDDSPAAASLTLADAIRNKTEPSKLDTPDEASADPQFRVTTHTFDEAAAQPNTNEIAGLLLNELEDVTPSDNVAGFAPLLRRSDSEDSAAVVSDFAIGNENSSGDPLADGQIQDAIENAVSHLDTKTAKSLANQDKIRESQPRLSEQLLRAAFQARRLVLWPVRGLWMLTEKAVASERTLVTGESFQRWDESLRRGLKHPLFLGVLTAGVLVAIAFMITSMQPERPDELDVYAIRKLKETQEAIRAVRATQPDEQTWAEFSQTLTGELNVLKEALQKDMQTNRAVKEGLYLALEYRLPRMLKEGRLKASAAEDEFAARIQNAERRIKAAPR